MSLATIVVPCFDEEKRLSVASFRDFRERQPNIGFLFVNDGSRDGTLALLRELERGDSKAFAVLDLQPNQGKAEAVRRGLLAALADAPAYVGYWDADLATPLDELPRFVELLEQTPAVEMLCGARVQLLGRSIERSAVRHYAGRVFATLASATLGLPIYDTQCGAKLFRGSEELRSLFEQPFCSNWVFDVEIIARMIAARHGDCDAAAEAIREVPLERWVDVPGSKVGAFDFLRALRELARVRRRYLGRTVR